MEKDLINERRAFDTFLSNQMDKITKDKNYIDTSTLPVRAIFKKKSKDVTKVPGGTYFSKSTTTHDLNPFKQQQ